MEIKTKYDVGQKLYWVSMRDGIARINFDAITRINIGGKSFEMYTIGSSNRGDRNLFVNFEEAKLCAYEKQKDHHDYAMKIIDEYKPKR